MIQQKQIQWQDQWSLFQNEEIFLFEDWIYPVTLKNFKDKNVLECGCGRGGHTALIAPIAQEITAVDLNTIHLARERNKEFSNINFLTADIATMDLKKEFDIVFSVGVVHHTNHPDKTFANLKRHVKRGGNLIIWVYSKEGNFLAENIIEPVRKVFLRNLNKQWMLALSKFITLLMYVPIYTVYLLPLKFLPYYDYFKNFRKLNFTRNTLNVFDKLNAPYVEFISQSRLEQWYDKNEFEDIHISSYNGVSWRASGVKK